MIIICELWHLLLYLLDASRVRHKSLQRHPAKKTAVSPPQITHSDLNSLILLPHAPAARTPRGGGPLARRSRVG